MTREFEVVMTTTEVCRHTYTLKELSSMLGGDLDGMTLDEIQEAVDEHREAGLRSDLNDNHYEATTVLEFEVAEVVVERSDWIVTFGQKYLRETHPTLGDRATPHGWLEIRDASYEEARAAANRLTIPPGGDTAMFAGQYVKDAESTKYYPQGAFMVVDRAGVEITTEEQS